MKKKEIEIARGKSVDSPVALGVKSNTTNFGKWSKVVQLLVWLQGDGGGKTELSKGSLTTFYSSYFSLSCTQIFLKGTFQLTIYTDIIPKVVLF